MPAKLITEPSRITQNLMTLNDMGLEAFQVARHLGRRSERGEYLPLTKGSNAPGIPRE